MTLRFGLEEIVSKVRKYNPSVLVLGDELLKLTKDTHTETIKIDDGLEQLKTRFISIKRKISNTTVGFFHNLYRIPIYINEWERRCFFLIFKGFFYLVPDIFILIICGCIIFFILKYSYLIPYYSHNTFKIS